MYLTEKVEGHRFGLDVIPTLEINPYLSSPYRIYQAKVVPALQVCMQNVKLCMRNDTVYWMSRLGFFFIFVKNRQICDVMVLSKQAVTSTVKRLSDFKYSRKIAKSYYQLRHVRTSVYQTARNSLTHNDVFLLNLIFDYFSLKICR